MTEDEGVVEYEEYGAYATEGAYRGALLTREWCEAHAIPFEPLYRKVRHGQ